MYLSRLSCISGPVKSRSTYDTRRGSQETGGHPAWQSALLAVHRCEDKDQHKEKGGIWALKTIKRTWCASGEQELVRDCALREAWVHNLQHGENHS